MSSYKTVHEGSDLTKRKQRDSVSDHPNTVYEMKDRTITVFWSGSWCVAINTPDFGKDSGEQYDFASGIKREERAHQIARNWAETPLSDFDNEKT